MDEQSISGFGYSEWYLFAAFTNNFGYRTANIFQVSAKKCNDFNGNEKNKKDNLAKETKTNVNDVKALKKALWIHWKIYFKHFLNKYRKFLKLFFHL